MRILLPGFLTCFAALCCAGVYAAGQAEGGLGLRSYESIQDERTGLVIPAPGERLRLDDYLGLAFDVKLRGGADAFGYVARVIIGGQTGIDVMMSNPGHAAPFLCVIRDGELLAKIDERVRVGEWNHVELVITVRDGRMDIAGGGGPIASGLALPHDRHVQICFGANAQPGFATTDVPPVTLRGIEISVSPGRVLYNWPLVWPAEHSVLPDSTGRMNATVVNPHWVMEEHLGWKLERTVDFPGVVFPVVDPVRGELWLIDRESVSRFDPVRDSLWRYDFSPPLPVGRICDQFIADPLTRQLVYYDFQREPAEAVSRFDMAKRQWIIPVTRHGQPANRHHSKFFNPLDSAIVQLFGYGFYRYHNEMQRIAPDGTVVNRTTPPDPRYLAATGMADSVLYIFGGLGNRQGLQEYGTRLYNDLWRLDLRDYSFTLLWENEPGPQNELAASSLVVSPDGTHAKALFFTPLRFQSYLLLKDIDLATGGTAPLADTIRYSFRDTESDADLVYNARTGRYYAVVVDKTEGAGSRASIYSIADPVMTMPPAAGPTGRPWLVYILSALFALCMGGSVYFLAGRRRPGGDAAMCEPDVTGRPVQPAVQTPVIPAAPRGAGIYLLGGFQVIDRGGQDITGEFTPIMRQLLSLVILYSAPGRKGISNARLKELLWYDKTEESSRNNRSVHMSKIRMLLETVGDLGITSANSYWMALPGQRVKCDYLYAMNFMCETSTAVMFTAAQLSSALEIASWGVLLPEMIVDWLDDLKAAYSDSVTQMLGRMRDSEPWCDEQGTSILLSDGILRFDSLDEPSVRSKCRALVALKRIGSAKSAFELFTKEYQQLMGQKFASGFEKFIK